MKCLRLMEEGWVVVVPQDATEEVAITKFGEALRHGNEIICEYGFDYSKLSGQLETVLYLADSSRVHTLTVPPPIAGTPIELTQNGFARCYLRDGCGSKQLLLRRLYVEEFEGRQSLFISCTPLVAS